MKFDPKALLAQKAERIEKFLQELTAKMAEKPTLVVIGGFAVRAHGSRRFSHDGDIMVDYRTHGELRDQFTLYRNPRLGKEQFLTPFGADVDVYVENQHKLRVPFDEIQAFAEKKNGLWVACAEHLVVLKLDALKSRRHSDKGDKDTEDILVLITCAKLERTSILKQHLLSEDWALLFDIVDTPGNWQKLTQNNYKKASALQKEAQATLKALRPGEMEIE
jgi:hypothetical protein